MRGGVFICHASEDAETARQIVGALERAGVECWIAPRDIEVGETYTQAILEALKAAPALVLVFSAAADRSPHVVRELETAVGSATRIVPVRLEAVEPSPSLRYFIGTAQWLDVAGRAQAEWEAELVAALRRTVAGQRDSAYAAGEPAAAATQVGVGADRPRSRRVAVVAAIGVAVVVVLGVGLGVKVLGSDDSSDSARDEPTATPTPSESTGTPTAPAESVLVAEESFQDGPGPFGVGDLPVNDGVMTREVRRGAYRVGVSGIGAGWDSWNFVELAAISDLWSVTTRVARADGFCGVMVGDGVTTYTAVVNGAGTIAGIDRHVGGRTPQERQFPIEPAGSGPITLSRDGDVLVLSSGQRRVAVVEAVDLGPITEAGLDTVGDTATCEFDGFSVAHAK